MHFKSYTLLVLLALTGVLLAQAALGEIHDASTSIAAPAFAAFKQPNAIAHSDALTADNMIDFSYDDTADWADALSSDDQAADTADFSLDDALDEADDFADQDAIDAEYAVEASLDDLAPQDQGFQGDSAFATEDQLDEDSLDLATSDSLDFAVEDALTDEDPLEEDAIADADFSAGDETLVTEDDAADFAVEDDEIEDEGFAAADYALDDKALEDDALEPEAAASSAADTDAIASDLDATAESVADDLFNQAVNDAIEAQFAQEDTNFAGEDGATDFDFTAGFDQELGVDEASSDYSREEEAMDGDGLESELTEALFARPTLFAKSYSAQEDYAADAFDSDMLSAYQYHALAHEGKV